jgi:hypothetical protein
VRVCDLWGNAFVEHLDQLVQGTVAVLAPSVCRGHTRRLSELRSRPHRTGSPLTSSKRRTATTDSIPSTTEQITFVPGGPATDALNFVPPSNGF